jgi:hypothetical protein
MVDVKYSILGVEGQHDQAFIGKMLELYGLKKFGGQHKHIDSFWTKFIPTYPRDGRLYDRLGMPSIFTSETHSVAIYAGGGSNLTRNLRSKMSTHRPYTRDIYAFGLVLDADKNEKKLPEQIARETTNEWRELFPDFPQEPGRIVSGRPRSGIYILPDNKNLGALESILLKCASVSYPEYSVGAQQFIDGVDEARKGRWKPFDAEKALVACIVSVLKPGMSNTSSIAQDEWVCANTANCISEVSQFGKFLVDLLELDTIPLYPDTLPII